MQVSRLGNPLVNEVVIPTALKDEWNARAGQRQAVRRLRPDADPRELINQLYPVDAPETNRDDLVAVFAHRRPGPEQHRHEASPTCSA